MRSIDSTFGMLFIFLMLFILHVRYSAATKDEAQNTQDAEIDEEQDESDGALQWKTPFHGGLDGSPLQCEKVKELQSEWLKYKHNLEVSHDALIQWLQVIPKKYKVRIPEKGLDMTTPLTWLFKKKLKASLLKAFPSATINPLDVMEEYEKNHVAAISILNTYFQMVAKVVQQDAEVLLNYYRCKASTFRFRFRYLYQYKTPLFSLALELPSSRKTCKDLIQDIHLPLGGCAKHQLSRFFSSEKDKVTCKKEDKLQSNLKTLVNNYFDHRDMALKFFIVNHWLTICSFRSPSLSNWILKETKRLLIPHPEATNSLAPEKVTSVSSTMAMPTELELSKVLSLPFTPTFSLQLEQQFFTFDIREEPSHFVCDTEFEFQFPSVSTRLRSIFYRLFTSFLPHSCIATFLEKFNSEASVEESLHWITDKEFFEAFYSNLPREVAPLQQEIENRRQRITETIEKMQGYSQKLQEKSRLGKLREFFEDKVDEPSFKVHSEKREQESIPRATSFHPIQLTIQYLPIFPIDTYLKLKKHTKSNSSLFSKFDLIGKFTTLHNQLQATYFEYLLRKENTDYCRQERANRKKAERDARRRELRLKAAV